MNVEDIITMTENNIVVKINFDWKEDVENSLASFFTQCTA